MRAYLRSGELKIGDRLPGERDLAATLGLSRSTLRSVLEIFEEEGALVRRPQSGTFLSAVPMPSGKGALAAIIAPLTGYSDLQRAHEPFWIHRVVSAFERAAAVTGLRVLVMDQFPRRDDPCSVIDLIREAADAGAKAVVLFHALGTRHKLTHALAVAHDLGIHPVMVSSRSFSGLGSEVYFDSSWGAYIATRSLLTRGHTRIGFIGSTLTEEWVRDRMNGYQNALAASDISPLTEWLQVRSEALDVDETADARAAFKNWLALPKLIRPTAIFAASDRLALAYIDAAKEKGLETPRDYSIVGFDNDPRALLAGLTTVERPTDALGEAVAKVTLERLNASPEGGEAVAMRLRPILIERSSIACFCDCKCE